jgi:hypothetical protein
MYDASQIILPSESTKIPNQLSVSFHFMILKPDISTT